MSGQHIQLTASAFSPAPCFSTKAVNSIIFRGCKNKDKGNVKSGTASRKGKKKKKIAKKTGNRF